MNIKHTDGKVSFVMRTGKVFVRSEMPIANAIAIYNTGKKVEETDKRGFGMEICVDDTYFFPIDKSDATDETTKPTRKGKKKEVTE